MKKFTIILLVLLACSFQMRAQQFVSTEPSNRNVVIEEFTGRNCGYCPDGHKIANTIAHNNPGRVWPINYHALGGLSPTNYPNLNTDISNVIESGFAPEGLPMGVVNRSTAQAVGRNMWTSYANNQLGETAELNIAGRAVIDMATKIATIDVEVYYTGNSSVDENFLTVAMLQDSILGYQAGASTNPEQVMNGTYCHMHIFRDMVTEGAWGEGISPTTQGTLITRQYQYAIPESIGSPNGVEVVLDHLIFLAWVSERQQGNTYRPILSACKLDLIFGSDQPVNPAIRTVAQEDVVSCQHSKTFNLQILNGGTEDITSMSLEAEIAGETFSKDWTGNIPSYETTDIVMEADVPFGSYDGVFRIVSANGQPCSFTKNATATCDEWGVANISGENEDLTINIWQDRFGNQTTWKVFGSDNSVIAEGGPYQMFFENTVFLRTEHVTVPANECIKFTIYDAVGNGICCTYGEGHYNILDSNNNTLVEGNGEFEYEESHLISLVSDVAMVVATTDVSNVGYNTATFTGKVLSGQPESVGFQYRKVTGSDYIGVDATLNDNSFTATVNDLDANSLYMVRAYAVADGETVYGGDLTFSTMAESIDEFDSSLNIYPNPSKDILNIEGHDIAVVELFNALGQKVLSQKVSDKSVQINTASLNQGVYFVRVTHINGFTVSRKISIAH